MSTLPLVADGTGPLLKGVPSSRVHPPSWRRPSSTHHLIRNLVRTRVLGGASLDQPDDGSPESDAFNRTEEGGVAEREEQPVAADEPIARSVGGGRDAYDARCGELPSIRAVETGVTEGVHPPSLPTNQYPFESVVVAIPTIFVTEIASPGSPPSYSASP